MNTDWQWVQLGEISEVISKGTTPTTHGVAFLDSGIPFLRAEDVVGGAVDVTSVKYYVSDKTHDTLLARSKLQPGDFLITIAGSLGRVGYVPLNAPPLNCNQAVAFVRLKPNVIDLDFLLYVFQYEGITKSLLDVQKVGTIGNLNLEQIRDFKIPLLPLTEQKRIASLLARADRLRQLRRKARELADSLLQSVFLEMFGDPKTNSRNWDMCIIDDVIAFSQYGTSEKSNSEKRGYPVLGMANITYEGKIDLEKLSCVELSDKEFADLKLERGDVIFNRTNSAELVGKTAFWNYDFDAVIASYLVKLKLKKDVLPEFFVGLLNTPHFKSLFQERCKKAVGQSNISPTLLKEFPMIVPPLSLQEEFATIVARVEQMRRRMSEAERQAEGLFESLLSESFGG